MKVYIESEVYQWTGTPDKHFQYYTPNIDAVCPACNESYSLHGLFASEDEWEDWVLCKGHWLIGTPQGRYILSDKQFQACSFDPSFPSLEKEIDEKLRAHVRKLGLPTYHSGLDPQQSYKGGDLYDLMLEELETERLEIDSGYWAVDELFRYLIDGGEDIKEIHSYAQMIVKEHKFDCLEHVTSKYSGEE